MVLIVDDFTQEDRAPVTQLRVPVAELVACVELREGGGALWHVVTTEDRGAVGLGHIYAQLSRQRVMVGQHLGVFHRCGGQTCIERLRQGGKAVVEGN